MDSSAVGLRDHTGEISIFPALRHDSPGHYVNNKRLMRPFLPQEAEEAMLNPNTDDYTRLMLSAQKWRMIAKTTRKGEDLVVAPGHGCGLCVKYNNLSFEKGTGCLRCPVYLKTGERECANTPWSKCYHTLDYLVSLERRVAYQDHTPTPQAVATARNKAVNASNEFAEWLEALAEEYLNVTTRNDELVGVVIDAVFALTHENKAYEVGVTSYCLDDTDSRYVIEVSCPRLFAQTTQELMIKLITEAGAVDIQSVILPYDGLPNFRIVRVMYQLPEVNDESKDDVQ